MSTRKQTRLSEPRVFIEGQENAENEIREPFPWPVAGEGKKKAEKVRDYTGGRTPRRSLLFRKYDPSSPDDIEKNSKRVSAGPSRSGVEIEYLHDDAEMGCEGGMPCTPASTITARDSRVESVVSTPWLRAPDAWDRNWVERGMTRKK